MRQRSCVTMRCRPLFSRWSLRRPGVATRMSGGWRKPSRSRPGLVPPTMHCTRTPGWSLQSWLASSSICCASSRVGEMMSTQMPCTLGARRMCSTAGIRNASVLPVPVLALARTSTPVSEVGMDACCTSVMNSYRSTSARARLLRALMGSSLKRLPVIWLMVVLDVRQPAGPGTARAAAAAGCGAGAGAANWGWANWAGCAANWGCANWGCGGYCSCDGCCCGNCGCCWYCGCWYCSCC
mmetsp:Transcript_22289/g.46805  ORF Transcript_22289/g.46805 Transcript_22289/m.46805 type:complete len:239 (-) Transcript_22289:255-971(-)